MREYKTTDSPKNPAKTLQSPVIMRPPFQPEVDLSKRHGSRTTGDPTSRDFILILTLLISPLEMMWQWSSRTSVLP